jgi:O-antigen chain-terminating methyltransferase
VDTNSSAILHCRELGLRVEKEDAIHFLARQAKESLGAVTAFHVLEHVPFDVTFRIVQEAARALKPGGLLVLEVPNPGNLLMGAHKFWYDPTHYRPLPARLLEFLVEYHGFSIASRLDLNPAPEEEQLPRQLEFISRLNTHLYGPQDYGIIARR